MTKQHFNAEKTFIKTLPYTNLLFNEYKVFDGDGAELSRKRREFCSEFFALAPGIQEMVVAAQSNESLERLVRSMERFKNPDTGMLTHQVEISMIQTELESRNHKTRKQITMNQLEKAMESLRNRR